MTEIFHVHEDPKFQCTNSYSYENQDCQSSDGQESCEKQITRQNKTRTLVIFIAIYYAMVNLVYIYLLW